MLRFDKLVPNRCVYLGSMLLLLTCGSVVAQTPGPSIPQQRTSSITPAQLNSQQLSTRRIRVRRINEPMKIDGRLDETAWAEADIAGDFRQQEPNVQPRPKRLRCVFCLTK